MRGTSIQSVLDSHFPSEGARLRAAIDLCTRAAVNPGQTTVPGWAEELTAQLVADFVATLGPQSALAQLRALPGARPFIFGREQLLVPALDPAIQPAAWVAEAGLIPAVAGVTHGQRLARYKVAAVAAWTRELGDASVGAIGRAVGSLFGRSFNLALDPALTSNAPASATTPAGIWHGVTGVPSVDRETDLATLSTTAAQWERPCLIVSPERLAGAWLDPALGPQLIARRIGPFALVTCPNPSDAGNVIALDAAEFLSAMGPPLYVESRHSQLALGDATTPYDVSTFQADLVAARGITEANWAMGSPGRVAVITGADW
jgi:hypothetical protein